MLSLSQKTYIAKILERFNIEKLRTYAYPMVKGHYLRVDMYLVKESGVKRMKRVSYSSVIESLMYTVLCARLDICFVVGFVS